jgi:GLPGLI family protein
MKYLFVIFICFSISTSSQELTENMYSITYINSFKDRLSSKFPKKEYSRLLVHGDSSIYQIYNVMKLDTLKYNGKATENDIINRYYSYNHYTIRIDGNNLSYTDVIAEDYYHYDEKLDFNWRLTAKTDTIGGYLCQSAVTTYAGRQWEAFFAPDIPINAGPYKFKGLPGLILRLSDSTGSYEFEFYGMITKPQKPFKKYFVPQTEFIKTDRITFNKIKANYSSLSLNDKLNYGNVGQKIRAIKVGDDGQEMRDPKQTEKRKNLNPIELDHKK